MDVKSLIIIVEMRTEKRRGNSGAEYAQLPAMGDFIRKDV
jgi:hypothetical protein